jgi:hypothetical protein
MELILNYFLSKTPFVSKKKLGKRHLKTIFFEGKRFKTLEMILKCNMP